MTTRTLLTGPKVYDRAMSSHVSATSVPTWRAVAAIIDHANLRPDATPDQIVRLCQEAIEFAFGEVMVNSSYLELAASELRGHEVKLASVTGFPFGATLTSVKEFEAAEALRRGANEIDMVLRIGELKAGNHAAVESDIERVATLVHQHRALLKVIIEAGLLTDEEKIAACQISVAAGADFAKTSTGFLGSGATVHDVELMRRTVGTTAGVKASGGIKNAAEAIAMLDAGATRLGTSSGVKIVTELREMQAASQRGFATAE
jgi:deoxyribose-phosphate aldolase